MYLCYFDLLSLAAKKEELRRTEENQRINKERLDNGTVFDYHRFARGEGVHS